MRHKRLLRITASFLLVFYFQTVIVAYAQNIETMDYLNSDKESFSSKLMKGVFRMARLKNLVERSAQKSEIKQEAAALPKSIKKK